MHVSQNANPNLNSMWLCCFYCRADACRGEGGGGRGASCSASQGVDLSSKSETRGSAATMPAWGGAANFGGKTDAEVDGDCGEDEALEVLNKVVKGAQTCGGGGGWEEGGCGMEGRGGEPLASLHASTSAIVPERAREMQNRIMVLMLRGGGGCTDLRGEGEGEGGESRGGGGLCELGQGADAQKLMRRAHTSYSMYMQ